MNTVAYVLIKLQRIPKGQSKTDNPEKLATQGKQYVLDTTILKQTQIT